MLRVVVDTNVIVSGTATLTGFPRQIVEAWRQQRFTLVMSLPLRAEIVNVMSRPKIAHVFGVTDEDAHDLLLSVDRLAEVIEPTVSPIAVRDPKDEMVLALAIQGGASYLVSGDRGLLALSDDERLSELRILPPRSFCEDVLSRLKAR